LKGAKKKWLYSLEGPRNVKKKSTTQEKEGTNPDDRTEVKKKNLGQRINAAKKFSQGKKDCKGMNLKKKNQRKGKRLGTEGRKRKVKKTKGPQIRVLGGGGECWSKERKKRNTSTSQVTGKKEKTNWSVGRKQKDTKGKFSENGKKKKETRSSDYETKKKTRSPSSTRIKSRA